MEQLKGWMREWKAGRKILGKNEYRDWAISIEDYKYKIGISIVDYTTDFAKSHQVFAVQNGLDFVITISHDSIEKCLSIFSLFDFSLLVAYINQNSNENFIPINKKIDEYIFKAIGDNIDLLKQSSFNHILLVWNMVKANLSNGNSVKKDDDWFISQVFNDIDIKAVLRVSRNFSKLITEKVNSKRSTYITAVLPIDDNYAILAGISLLSNLSFLTDSFIKANEKFHTHYNLIRILYSLETESPYMFICEPNIEMTNTERLFSVLSHYKI